MSSIMRVNRFCKLKYTRRVNKLGDTLFVLCILKVSILLTKLRHTRASVNKWDY